jgi:uncharacterized protein (TIGR00252 family)
MDDRRAFERGRWGEAAASQFLEAAGGEILARNWRDGPREIDLVVRFGQVIAFVEVKTRADHRWGHPFEFLTPRKRADLEQAARAWLATRRDRNAGAGEVTADRRPASRTGLDLRFDVVSVTLTDGAGEGPDIEHLPDAWRPGWE